MELWLLGNGLDWTRSSAPVVCSAGGKTGRARDALDDGAADGKDAAGRLSDGGAVVWWRVTPSNDGTLGKFGKVGAVGRLGDCVVVGDCFVVGDWLE